jgi:regulator of replication initiation timing
MAEEIKVPTVEELTTQVEALTTIKTTLTTKVEELTKENAVLKSVNTSLQAEVVAANAKAVAPKATDKKTEPVTHIGKSFVVGDKTYGIAYPKTVLKDGRAIDANNIIADKTLQEELVAANHSIVKLQA